VAWGTEGGAILVANDDQGSWLIVDEGTMADFLDEDDAGLALVSIERYATRQQRDLALASRTSRRRGG
jgi:hydrogenase maturation factor